MMTSCIALVIRLITGVQCCEARLLGDGPCVFVANHTSHFDFLVIWACLPKELRMKTKPVAAQDYWSSSPVRRWLSRSVFHALLLNRAGRSADGSHPLKLVMEALDDGYSVIIFPEGTRSTDGEMKPFKSGIYELARRCPRAKVVTIALSNLTRVLPKGEILPIPIIGTARFLTPTKLQEGEDKKSFLERLQKMIQQQLDKSL